MAPLIGDFDDIRQAMLILFEMSGFERWPVVMYHGMDVVGIDIAPSRDAERTRTTLRSGDALVFGGPSRLVYHGVERVKAGTAPAALGMRAGRLNLTFRCVF